jgi:hypothetical protein
MRDSQNTFRTLALMIKLKHLELKCEERWTADVLAECKPIDLIALSIPGCLAPHFSTWLPRCSKLKKLPIRKNFTWADWSWSTLHYGPLLDSKNAPGGYTTFHSPHKDINFQMARLSHSRTAGFVWVFDTSPVHKSVAPLPADTVDTLTPECSSSSQGWSSVLIRRCFWPVLWLCDNLVTLPLKLVKKDFIFISGSYYHFLKWSIHSV